MVLEEDIATIIKNDRVILKGKRNPNDHLWDIELPIVEMKHATKHYINAIIRKDTTKKDLADCLYQCCFSSPLSTFKVAIDNGNFLTWPGIDDATIKKCLSETMNTAKGHLDQEMKNLQSTKNISIKDNN